MGEHCGQGYGKCNPGLTCITKQRVEQVSFVKNKKVVRHYNKKVEPGTCRSGNQEGEHCGEGHGQCAQGLTCIKKRVVKKISISKNKRKEEHTIKKLKKGICEPENKAYGKNHYRDLKQKSRHYFKFQMDHLL